MAKPRNTETSRPYRLYHAQRKEALRWRCYKHPRNAHIGALIEVKFELKIGETLEVLNVTNGRVLGAYTREVNGVSWRPYHASRSVQANQEASANSQGSRKKTLRKGEKGEGNGATPVV